MTNLTELKKVVREGLAKLPPDERVAFERLSGLRAKVLRQLKVPTDVAERLSMLHLADVNEVLDAFFPDEDEDVRKARNDAFEELILRWIESE
jgi:hypothetical protein